LPKRPLPPPKKCHRGAAPIGLEQDNNWGVGTGKIQQNKAKIGAKKDKITEKRHFPMDFFHKTFNHSIPPIHQQIIMLGHMALTCT